MKNLAKFVFELGMLKRIKHEGWRLKGVPFPESVAEHTTRAAQLGYLLAKMEGYSSPEEVATILLFHDIGECRIGDLHKVAQRYVQANEERVVVEQTEPLGQMGEEILQHWKNIEKPENLPGIIAKDANLLEQLVTAKEYLEQGFATCQDIIDNVQKGLQTESAKALAAEMLKMQSTDWWQGLKKL